MSVAILAQGYIGFDGLRGGVLCFAGGLGGRRIISSSQASILLAFVCANCFVRALCFAGIFLLWAILRWYCPFLILLGYLLRAASNLPGYLFIIWWYLVCPATDL